MSDYLQFLEEVGLSPEQMEEALKSNIDYCPESMNRVEIHESKIHGYGAFASEPIHYDQAIGAGKVCSKWTLLGRFANHSHDPNMRANKEDFGFYFFALREIEEGEELTVNYRSVKAALEKEAA